MGLVLIDGGAGLLHLLVVTVLGEGERALFGDVSAGDDVVL